MEYTKIKLRRDIQINWNRVNPVLESGEIGIITDINKFKIGDGITSFVLLPFATYNADELDSKFQNIQVQITEIGGAELKERISAVEEKVEQNTNDITAIKGAGYLNSEEVNAIINGKDLATNTRVNEVENKIPNDTVTSGQLQAVETIANSKTTLEEVNQQGFAKDNELATVAKTGSYNDLSNKPNIPEQAVVDKELNINSDNAISNKAVTTKINSMDGEIASKTTMGEVEAKNFQTAEQVEQAIVAKDFATNTRVNEVENKIPSDVVTSAELQAVENIANSKTTLDEVAQQGYAKGTIPTNNNQLENGADYQNAEQVEQTITSKNYTTLEEVAQQGYPKRSEIPTSNADLTNDAHYMDDSMAQVNGFLKEKNFKTINNESIVGKGNIEVGGGGGADIEVENQLSGSTNPVENQAITNEVLSMQQDIEKLDRDLSNDEVWQFTMEDGSVVNKRIKINENIKYFYVEDASGVANEVYFTKGSGAKKPILEYSTDKKVWNSWSDPYTEHIPIAPNGKVYMRGTNKVLGAYSDGNNINSSGTINVGGDITTLLVPEGNVLDLTGRNYCFCSFFKNSKTLINAKDLILPSTTLSQRCYENMFYCCSSLTTAPILPATIVEAFSYRSMFYDCSSLTTAPILPATIALSECYEYMFSGCTSLTEAPILPATTLFSYCYRGMFRNCTSLTEAPILPATTLSISCYMEMFSGCTSLTQAPSILSATTLADSCYKDMFSGCTSLTTAPILPATTLKSQCYYGMFRNCTSLTEAPILSATTLASYCYNSMFWNCTSLNKVEVGATSWNESNTTNWLDRVSPNGTFIKPKELVIPTNNPSGIPAGWTIIDK